MSKMGVGAIIGLLSSNGVSDKAQFIGRTISSVSVEEKRVVVGFTDGAGFVLKDEGQSCCEYRYLTTDDDPNALVGLTFRDIVEKPGECKEEEGGECHDTMFVDIVADGAWITLCTHNEHNGWYGGFSIELTPLSPGEQPPEEEGGDE